MMAGLGISGDVIDECLNHMIESRMRRTYIRDRRLTEQQLAFNALGRRLASLISTTSAKSTRRQTTTGNLRSDTVDQPR